MRSARRMVRQRLGRARRRLLAPVLDETAWRVGLAGDEVKLMLGSMEARRAGVAPSLREAEFKVFSQWNEDGILQYLIARVPTARPVFVELGVEDYREANTRFLAANNNWRGLIVDKQPGGQRLLEATGLGWRQGIQACVELLTRDNINDVLARFGLSGDVGVLSIDVDGNDYWLWQAISSLSPRIVVCEFNSFFGPKHAVSIPYDAGFDRYRAHPSGVYFGCSLAALVHLGEGKGYRLVGCESHGANAFFVREDVAHGVEACTVGQAYVAPQFSTRWGSARDLGERGTEADLAEVADLVLEDVRTGAVSPIGDLYGLGTSEPVEA
jgi:hypothetical protein